MKKNQKELLDLVIIGASAAGSASAIYAARRNLNFTVVSKDIGGEVALSGDVSNWPGIIETTGIELAQNFHKHIQSYNVKIEEGYSVTDIKQEEKHHIVVAKNFLNEEKSYKTKAVIIASGIHPRNLNLPGETELRGRGVTYCTVCDGPLFKNKITTTIGAGNAAIESALMMAGIAKKVYLVTKFPNTKETLGGFPKAETILVNKVKKLANVEIIYNATTKEIIGKENLQSFKYIDNTTKEEKEINTDGLMVHVGMIPNSNFVTCSTKNLVGEIEVDIKCQTTCPGVFAAGDVTNIPYKQIVIAAGQGVTAVLSAIEYINKWEE
ncbi:MAG: FAD-dependent oxidoreductase [Candidatus Magasanikbacteria bacterium]